MHTLAGIFFFILALCASIGRQLARGDVRAGWRWYADDCQTPLIKYPKGAACYPKKRTGLEQRPPSVCKTFCKDPPPKSCFDPRRVIIEPGRDCHRPQLSSFLWSNYWHRDPSITSLWMSHESRYLNFLHDKYCDTGDRWLAFEFEEMSSQHPKLIGVLQAQRVFPRTAAELEYWASRTIDNTDRYRKFFEAYLIRGPDLFNKYNVPYLYMVQLLVTAPEVQGQGLGKRLLRHAIAHSSDVMYPVIVVPAISHYMNKVCLRWKMKREWAMDYADYCDESGMKIFFPRTPHNTVVVYSKLYNPKDGPPIMEF